jgi:hypothetical protein
MPADDREGREVAEGTTEAVMSLGGWGFLLAIPAILLWAVRKLRRRAA